MANYTIELRTLLKTDFIPALNDYPIFDETYRATLNKLILDHYAFYEIGLETPDMFNHYLMAKMNEIMPRYNELYRVQAQMINPLTNFSYSETMKRDTNATNSGETTSAGTAGTSLTKGTVKNKNIRSDTPQGNIDIFNVDAGGYATEVNQDVTEYPGDDITQATSDNETQTTGQAATVDEYVRTISGYQNKGVASLFDEYAKAFRDINQMIIADLSGLFMGVY